MAETGDAPELLELVRDADAILTCWKNVSAAVIRAGKKVQVVSRYGIGVDNIAVGEATRLGIPVTNVPAYCLDEVSEHVMALILACGRQVCKYNQRVRDGIWDVQAGTPLHRVRGSTLGIIGFGKIGRTLAPKARGFGMKVLVFDPYVDADSVKAAECEKAELDTLLNESDYVSVHVPLNETTRHMLDETTLRQMKPTAYLINAARGDIIDQGALARSLQEGWIAGAGLDVFEPERLPSEHPLLQSTKVIATPHVAFYSEESVIDLEVLAAKNVAAVLSGHRPKWVVNPEVLDLPRWSHLK
jgi:D-3-phosphoglycerate dehydrogenase